MENAVGPVLRMSDDLDQIVNAIEDDNPGADIEVIDRGAYVRIQAPSFLRVTEASLQRYLGHDFRLRSLEAQLSAFAGRINTTSEEITWSLGGATQAPTAREAVEEEVGA